MSSTPSRSSGTLLTLDRGIRVLEDIARGSGAGTAKSIGANLGINPGTIYQILRTLQNNGYVHRLPEGRYQLGARIAYLLKGYQVQAAPPQAIIDHLHSLYVATEETVYASIALGSSIAVVASHESTKRLRVGTTDTGNSANPHASASGKAFLAICEEKDLDDYFDNRKLECLTHNTICDWDALLVEFETIRREGVAFDREESDLGISCIGAAILGPHGQPIGAYAAAMPVARFEQARESVAAALLKAGGDASRALGYTAEYPPEYARSHHSPGPKKPFVSR